MAAIDPNEDLTGSAPTGKPARATLKIVREPGFDEDEEDDEVLRRILADASDDDDDSDDDDEEVNGSSSDPSKSKKARKEAALGQIKKALEEQDDHDMELDGPANGTISKGKGKAKATDDDDEDEDSDDDRIGEELEEFVLCTLDPEKVLVHTFATGLTDD